MYCAVRPQLYEASADNPSVLKKIFWRDTQPFFWTLYNQRVGIQYNLKIFTESVYWVDFVFKLLCPSVMCRVCVSASAITCNLFLVFFHWPVSLGMVALAPLPPSCQKVPKRAKLYQKVPKRAKRLQKATKTAQNAKKGEKKGEKAKNFEQCQKYQKGDFIVSVLLSAHVERFIVFRMQDFQSIGPLGRCFL